MALKLISGWYRRALLRARGRRRDGGDHAPPAAAQGHGLDPCGLCRYLARPPWRHLGPDLEASRARARGMAGLWPPPHRAGRAHGGFRRRHGFPPPHGHHRRDRCRGRPADEAHRQGGGPAVRHRPLAVRGRRSAGAAEAQRLARRARPLQGCAPRHAGQGAARGHELHGGRDGGHLHRAGRRLHRLSADPPDAGGAMAIPAGWSSRPSRTRARRIR